MTATLTEPGNYMVQNIIFLISSTSIHTGIDDTDPTRLTPGRYFKISESVLVHIVAISSILPCSIT